MEALYKESPEAVFAMDINGRFLFVNPKFKELLGYDLEEMPAWKEKMVQSDVNEVQQHFRKAAGGSSASFTAMLRNKQGALIPAELTFIPMMSANKTTFIFGICKVETKEKTDPDQTLPLLYKPGTILNRGTWEYDVTEKKCFWSNEMHEIFATDPVSFEPSLYSTSQFVHPDDRKVYRKALKNALKKGISSVLLYRIIDKSGRERCLLERFDAVRDHRGRMARFIGFIEQITGVSKLDEKMTISKQTLLSLADHLYAAIWSYNFSRQKITFCSVGIERIFGINMDAFLEDPEVLLKSVHPEDTRHLETIVSRVFGGERQTLRFRIFDENGMIKWVHGVFIPVLDQEGKLSRIDGVFQDITQEKNYTEALSRLAYFDSLTKLPNRHYFEEYVNDCIKKAELVKSRFAVFYLDLDMFDYINDTYGHDVGDKLLVAISLRLRAILDEKSFLSRIAGDEFTLIIDGITEVNEALPAAKKIIKEMDVPFYIDGYELFVTISIGISFFPTDGRDSQTLLKNANHALKRIRDKGRNDWQIFSPSLDVRSYKSFQLESDLHKAVENDEFYLVYQPKVDTRTRKIMGAEALIRWNHPDWGMVSPGEFIRMAEDNGCIFEIGDWVLKKVCQTLSKWEKENLPLVPISVNISPKRLLKTDFVDSVKGWIMEAGINPALIELELTEYVLVKDIDKAKQIISGLKAFGLRFALDDFGTGYSSLSYLMDLDFDILKIDKSFIDGIGSNKTNEGIIKSTVLLGKELGLRVVAEGVEKMDQFRFLYEQGCHMVQGFLFSEPVGEKEFKQLLLEGGALAVKETAKDLPPLRERRKYYRLKFDFPLEAEMTVLKFKNKNPKLGMSKALIKDISLGGLRYISNVNLPVQEDFILLFVTEIFKNKREFTGRNVWKKPVNGLYEYGVEFTMSDKEREQFAPVFRQLSDRIRINPLLPDCSFLREDAYQYFEV